MRVPFSGRGFITCALPTILNIIRYSVARRASLGYICSPSLMASKRSWSSPTGLTPTQKERRQYVAQTQSTSQPRKRLDFGESTAHSSKPLSSLWSKEEEGALVDYVIRKGFVLSWPTTKRKRFWEDAALSLAPYSKRTSKPIYSLYIHLYHGLYILTNQIAQ